jgi:CRISPR/Cas system-associated exonuclease Cas4 (RecB family)
MKEIRLSPSTLNLFLECPRCFWLHINERIHRPRGIFPSLPGGMDGVIKTYFDKYRAKGELPPEIKGKVEGKLMSDLGILNKWRDWRTGLAYKDEALGVTLFGALDDVLQDGKHYMPLDYKTRGYPPREGDSQKYYGNQIDSYALMLQENGYPVKDFGYLIYYYPKEVSEEGRVDFNVEVVKLTVDPNRAKKVLNEAMKLLNGSIPLRHSECEYCLWGRNNGD